MLKRLLARFLYWLGYLPSPIPGDPGPRRNSDDDFWSTVSTEDGSAWIEAGCPRTSTGKPDMAAVAREQHVQQWLEQCPYLPSEFLRWWNNSHGGLLGVWLIENHGRLTRNNKDLVESDLRAWLRQEREPIKVCRTREGRK